MVSSEVAARIACSFITVYYKHFVEDFSSLLPLYSEASCVSFAAYNEIVGITSQGKSDIRAHYDRLQERLGQRKVQIRNADFVPSGEGGSVLVTCSGQVFTRQCHRVFLHSFVLSPTKFRENTLHISAECLRFLSEEAEVIPPNCVIATPEEYHHSLVERSKPPQPTAPKPSVEQHAMPAAAPLPATETPPRKERVERPRRAKPVEAEEQPKPQPAQAESSPQVDAKPKERPPRERKPRGAAAGDSAPRERKLTSKVRLADVPKFIKLSDIRPVASEHGTVVDLLWFQDTDAIVEFSSPKEARNLVIAESFTVKRKLLARSFHFDTTE
jgi:hypothetical protein